MSNEIDAMHRYMSCIRPDRTPPPFSQIYAAFQADPASEHLRFGQWFYNRFMGATFGELRELADKLHATQSKEVAFELIKVFYKDYQWPM